MKVREGGRVINAVVLVATGVNADGRRAVLGLRIATSETGAAWNSFFADLVARRLGCVRLVTSRPHHTRNDVEVVMSGTRTVLYGGVRVNKTKQQKITTT